MYDNTNSSSGPGCLDVLGEIFGLVSKIIVFAIGLAFFLLYLAMAFGMIALAILFIPLDIFIMLVSAFSGEKPPSSACGELFKHGLAILEEAQKMLEQWQNFDK